MTLAEAARRQSAERVLILDWDVHHGNGMQAAFWTRRDVLYMSVHQYPYVSQAKFEAVAHRLSQSAKWHSTHVGSTNYHREVLHKLFGA